MHEIYRFILCFTTSYITIPAETEAFNELILPFIGILSNTSQFSFTKFDIPFPSFPITIAIAPVKFSS